MARRIVRSGFGDFGFYIVVVSVAILAWQSQSWMTSLSQRQLREQSQAGIVGTALTQLDNIQERQLDAYLEVNRLLTTFGTTLLGALGFLLFGQQKVGTWNRHRWAVLLGVLCVAISIFFGYVAYLFILSMLRDGIFDLTSSNPHWAQQAHFYTFLAGVIFLADFVFHNLTEEGGRENLHDVTRS
jgi:hypothetical protein